MHPDVCVSCDDPDYTCGPQDDSGWLCCTATGVCIAVATYDSCDTGIAGWCSDYSTETVNGIEIATCEDG
jgi:hypothetical protein